MRIILSTFILICFACTSNVGDIDIAENFVKSVILDNNFDVSLLGEYVTAENTTLEDKQMQEVLAVCIAFVKEGISENDGVYEIVPSANENYHEIIKEYNLNYDDTEQTFYVVTDEKVITHIIVKNQKVISFYTTITKKNRNLYPWIL